MRKAEIVQKPNDEIPAEIIAQEIIKISKAMESFNRSKLTRDAIVALIHDKTKILKGTINIVLNNLENLENTWLKKTKGPRQ